MEFTLKQLYGYSIMNWEQFKMNLVDIIWDRECSFCEDSDLNCEDCRIDPTICKGMSESIYIDIWRTEVALKENVDFILNALKDKYEECD